MRPTDSSDVHVRAQEVLAWWLANADPPRRSGLERLCRAHPELAGMLRELFAAWLVATRALPQRGGGAGCGPL